MNRYVALRHITIHAEQKSQLLVNKNIWHTCTRTELVIPTTIILQQRKSKGYLKSINFFSTLWISLALWEAFRNIGSIQEKSAVTISIQRARFWFGIDTFQTYMYHISMIFWHNPEKGRWIFNGLYWCIEMYCTCTWKPSITIWYFWYNTYTDPNLILNK